MNQDGEVEFAGGVHEGGHGEGVGDVEVLGVGVEFADAAGAAGGAALDFFDGVDAPGGVNGAEGDEAAFAGGRGAQEIAVGFAGDVLVGPAKAEDDGGVHVGFLHGDDDFGAEGGLGLGVAEEIGVGLVATHDFFAADGERGRVEVGVEVDDHVFGLMGEEMGGSIVEGGRGGNLWEGMAVGREWATAFAGWEAASLR